MLFRSKMIACGTEPELVSMVTDVKTVYVETKIPVSFDRDAFCKKVKLMPGIRGIIIEDSLIRVDISIEENSIERIIQEFISYELPINNIKSEVPNLDTLFLTLTGRELR